VFNKLIVSCCVLLVVIHPVLFEDGNKHAANDPFESDQSTVKITKRSRSNGSCQESLDVSFLLTHATIRNKNDLMMRRTCDMDG
jgi:hypothetical protein